MVTGARLGDGSATVAVGESRDDSPMVSKREWANVGIEVTVAMTTDGNVTMSSVTFVVTFHFHVPHSVFVGTRSGAAVTLSADVPVTVVVTTESVHYETVPLTYVWVEITGVRGADPLPVDAPFLGPVGGDGATAAMVARVVEFEVGPSLTATSS